MSYSGWYGVHPLVPLSTRDKHGHSHRFYYHIDDHGFVAINDFSVSVLDAPEWPPDASRWPWYQLSVKRNDDGVLQTVNMDNYDSPTYRGKGITQVLLPEIATLVREDIISSPPFEHYSNRRSASATVVWERLVVAGLARREGDCFRLFYARSEKA
jgi:hypothetical protein